MDAEAERSAIAVGSTVGPYKLLRLLGTGASGQVFEVEHTVIGRRAALKLLNADHALLPSALRRLFAEAQAVNRINHPHIVEITDVLEPGTSGGPAGVVMELLEGESLAELISRRKRLTPEQIPGIMAQVADALAGAHGAGFVHRDLKPENVFLAQPINPAEGGLPFVKLLDFGLAKSLVLEESGSGADTLPGRSHRTVEGTFLGTPAYASPEQAAGKPVDHRTDIYAFGVILYELLCGKLPFEGQNLGEYLVKHITVMPPPVPEEIASGALGGALGEMAMRCLRKDPASRYGSAAEMRDELRRLAATLVPRGAGPEVVGAGRPWGRRRMVAVAGAAVAAAVAGAVAVLLTGRNAARRPQATVEAGPGRLIVPARPAVTPITRVPAAGPGSSPAPVRPGGPSAGWVPIPPRRRTSAKQAAPVPGSRRSGQRERTLDPWRR